MAVTQQLARINPERAESAAAFVDALTDLLNYHVYAEEEIADFDWAPRYLELALAMLGRNDLVLAVTEAFDGKSILNSEYPCGGEDVVYSEVRLNRAEEVKALALLLVGQPIEQMAGVADLVIEVIGKDDLSGKAAHYIRQYATKLSHFYEIAARQGQAVVTWWD